MPKIDDSIEVQVSVEQAYNQWTQFEEFPKPARVVCVDSPTRPPTE